MSANEVWVAIVFGYIGYLIVSVFLSKKMKPNKPKSNSYSNKKFSSQSQNESSQDYQKEPSAHDGDLVGANWFHILNVPKTASMEIITSAYKRKISEYHPDKVANLGSELKELAELKSKQINAAYNHAKKLNN